MIANSRLTTANILFDETNEFTNIIQRETDKWENYFILKNKTLPKDIALEGFSILLKMQLY